MSVLSSIPALREAQLNGVQYAVVASRSILTHKRARRYLRCVSFYIKEEKGIRS